MELAMAYQPPSWRPTVVLRTAMVVVVCLIVIVGFVSFWANVLMTLITWGSGTGVVLHTVVSPDAQITALVVSDDCGATCSCRVRVDVQTSDRLFEAVYRSYRACDATVTWRSPTELDVRDDVGGQQHLDLRSLGITP